jgi:hypothetical protein
MPASRASAHASVESDLARTTTLGHSLGEPTLTSGRRFTSQNADIRTDATNRASTHEYKPAVQ